MLWYLKYTDILCSYLPRYLLTYLSDIVSERSSVQKRRIQKHFSAASFEIESTYQNAVNEMRKVKTEARYIHLYRQFRSTALPTLCSNYVTRKTDVTHSIVSPKQSQDAFRAPMQTFLRHSADYIQQVTIKEAKWIAPKIYFIPGLWPPSRIPKSPASVLWWKGEAASSPVSPTARTVLNQWLY